jgi:hypothetical protein
MKLEKSTSQNETGETQPSDLQEQKKESFREKINRLASSLKAKFAEFGQNKQSSKATMESVDSEADFTPEEQEQLSAIESSAQLETEKAEALLGELESGESATNTENNEPEEPVVEKTESPESEEKKEKRKELNKELEKEMGLLTYCDDELQQSTKKYEETMKLLNTPDSNGVINSFGAGKYLREADDHKNMMKHYQEAVNEHKGKVEGREASLRELEYST